MTATRAQVGIASNRDIHVSPDYAASFSALTDVLLDKRFQELFDTFDAASRKAKRTYAILGVVAVVLGVAALEAGVWTLETRAESLQIPGWESVAFSFVAICALVITLGVRVAGLRYKWLRSVFLRERLRQWRHQMLLDGPLMDLATSDPPRYHSLVDTRWAKFLQEAAVADGAFEAFVGPAGATHELYVDAKVAGTDAVRDQVLEVQHQLRLAYQLQYAETKGVTGAARPSISELTYATDWMATATLVAAVGLGVAALVLQALSNHGPRHTLLLLTASGPALAILSAGIRTIRAGLTIPLEGDSYADYASRLQAIAEVYRQAPDDTSRWKALANLEVSSVEELRRFLRIKMSSRFLL